MDTLFRDVPCDVIRKFILPCLDVESSVNFNRIMPPYWRASNRFKPKFCENHERAVVCAFFRDKLQRITLIDMYGIKKRAMFIKQYFAALNGPRAVYSLSQMPNMKKTLMAKSLDFSRDQTYDHFDIKISTKRKLIKLAKKVYNTYENC